MDLHHHHHHPNPTTTAASTTTNSNPNKAEAERLLGIAEKLLQSRDLTGSREFAMLAQETEPLLEGSDQILAITDVLLASDRRVNNNRHHDWYSILQTDRRATASDPDLLKKNYRRLALLLHPDKNKYPLSDAAFKLVADAWAVLSDPSKRTPYDHELSLFSKVDLRHQQPPPRFSQPPQPQQTQPPPPQQNQQNNTNTNNLEKDKLPVRRSPRGGIAGGGNTDTPPPHQEKPPAAAAAAENRRRGGEGVNRVAKFWTACPYCYVLYEYPREYEDCCLRCQNCERAFHAAQIPSLPPMVPGKEAYYCCWGFFPLGFSLQKGGGKGVNNNVNNENNVGGGNNENENNVGNVSNNPNSGFPNWMPAGMFNATPVVGAGPQGLNVNMNMNVGGGGGGGGGMSDGSGSAGGMGSIPMGVRMGGIPGAKKRGRPRKNPLPS